MSPCLTQLASAVVNPIVVGSSPVRGAFVKVLTLATKRLNARRREIDRRAFFVSTKLFPGFQRFSRFAGQSAALSVCGEISVSRTQPSRLHPPVRKIGPELSDSLFSGASRVNTEFSFGVQMRRTSKRPRLDRAHCRVCRESTRLRGQLHSVCQQTLSLTGDANVNYSRTHC